MLLSIKEMEVRKIVFAETWQPGEIDFDPDAAGICQIGPLRAEGEAGLLPVAPSRRTGRFELGEEVRVQGKVEATLQTDCDRCLGRASFPVSASFDLFYRPVDADAMAAEVAIDEGEAEMGFYEMPGIVLEDVLREQLLLQLPMQRVCGEACKGICPVCGVNRNESACDARVAHPAAGSGDDSAGSKATDARWGALASLKVQ